MPSRTFTFGPEVCGSLRSGRPARVAGPRRARRLRHGHGQRPAHPPLPRAAGGRRRHPGPPDDGPGLARPGPDAARRRPGRLWPPTSGPPGRWRHAGHTLLERFDLNDGLPRWRWRVGDVVLERTVAAAARGRRWSRWCTRCSPGRPVELTVEPLCTWRDVHGERHAGGGLRADRTADGVVVEDAYRVAGPGFAARPTVVPRRLPPRGGGPRAQRDEDLLRVGRFDQRRSTPGESLEITRLGRRPRRPPPPPAREVIADGPGPSRPAGRRGPGRDRGRPRPGRRRVHRAYRHRGRRGRRLPVVRRLVAGHDDRVRGAVPRHRARRRGPGAAARVRRHPVGGDAGQHRRHRRRSSTTPPTRRCGSCTPSTGTCAATGDDDLAAELVGPLDEVVASHLAGCRYGIRVDPADGLLTQGAAGYALTWMDAVIDGVPVTPRAGKAVELNALWINGLAAVGGLRERVGRDRADLDALRATAIASFAARFPVPGGAGCTTWWTVPDGDGRDRCAPTSCSPSACRTRRCGASTPAGGASGRPGPAHPARTAQSRPATTRATGAPIGAGRPSATPPITRAPCGRG